MATYQPGIQSNWQGQTDGTDKDMLRWHQVIQCINLDEKDPEAPMEYQQGIALLGFCCDEGIKRINGKPGAARAPEAIRNACCNFPFIESETELFDAGDVICDNADMEAAQALLGEKVKQLRRSGYLPIVLGGGHEVSYGCFMGLQPMVGKAEFGWINFDAHFNLMAPVNGFGANAFTACWQMREYCLQHHHPFHYLAIGIQQYSNTSRMFNRASELGAVYFLAEGFTNDQLEQILHSVNGILGNAELLQLSVDLDVFAAAHAPGVSAASFNGIAPNSMFKRLLRHIILSGKVATIDIAETNPLLDEQDRTVRLAASIVFDIVQAADKNAEW